VSAAPRLPHRLRLRQQTDKEETSSVITPLALGVVVSPAAFGALGVAALEPLESLTPAFQREHACCRELADGHRRWTGRRFATFLDQLAEKIFY